MVHFFTSSFFVNFVIPLITVVLSIFIKCVSRKDNQPTFKKEDLSVGFELALASLFAFATDTVSTAHRLTSTQDMLAKQFLENRFVTMPWILLAYIVGLWGVSTLVRKLGWDHQNELTWFFGIVIPLIFGMACLIFVVSWIG